MTNETKDRYEPYSLPIMQAEQASRLAAAAGHEGEVYCQLCGASEPAVGVCPACKGLYCAGHFLQGDHTCLVDLGIGN